MSLMEKTILAAMKENAPELLAELKQNGSLDQFVQEKAEETSSQINSLAMQIANHHGMEKADWMQRVAIFNGALHHAREIVLSEQLEFQPEETSPERPDETTD